MTPYLFVFGILSAFAIANHVKQFRQMRLYYFILSALMLILFAGLRQAGVGTDDLAYVMRFHEIPDISFWVTGEYVYSYSNAMQQEFGFTLLSSIVNYFTSDYRYLFLLIAFLSVGIASYNYYQYTPFVFLAFLLFFVHTYLYRDINQIRAAVAAAIALFLIQQFYYKQHIKIVLTICIASLFHVVSIILFLPYLLSFLKITRKRLVVGIVIAFMMALVGASNILIAAFPDIGFLTTKVINYANSHYAESVSLFDITNIKNLVLFLLLIYYWNFLKEKVKYFDVMMMFYFLAVSWRVAFSDLGILAARVATMFGVVEVVLVPAFVLLFRQKLIPTILIILYAFATLYLNLFVKEGRNPYELSISIF